MSDELKPCPFCGSLKINIIEEFSITDHVIYHTECCYCSVSLYNQKGINTTACGFPSKKRALKAWNTRHNERESR